MEQPAEAVKLPTGRIQASKGGGAGWEALASGGEGEGAPALVRWIESIRLTSLGKREKKMKRARGASAAFFSRFPASLPASFLLSLLSFFSRHCERLRDDLTTTS